MYFTIAFHCMKEKSFISCFKKVLKAHVKLSGTAKKLDPFEKWSFCCPSFYTTCRTSATFFPAKWWSYSRCIGIHTRTPITEFKNHQKKVSFQCSCQKWAWLAISQKHKRRPFFKSFFNTVSRSKNYIETDQMHVFIATRLWMTFFECFMMNLNGITASMLYDDAFGWWFMWNILSTGWNSEKKSLRS